MIAEAAAAGSAATWGAADFSGGKASQQADARAVVVVSQASSLLLLLACLAFTAQTWPAASDLGWGFTAGLVGAFGLILLYRALSAGAMSVVAPVTAMTAALLPLGVGLLWDRMPGRIALAGAGCAVAAIGLVSLGSPSALTRVSAGVVGLSLAAGTAFGLFFALLEPVSGDAGLWPLVGVRAASLLVAGVLVWRARVALRLTGRPLRWALAGGVLDMTANALYLAAAYNGLLSVVAPIASLYPASTVALALLIDHERVSPAQILGLGLAATALVLVSLGTA
jgi:uncharacterized membrane protein